MRHRQLAKAFGNSYPYRLTATASFIDSTMTALKCSVADLPARGQFDLIQAYFAHFRLLLRNSLWS